MRPAFAPRKEPMSLSLNTSAAVLALCLLCVPPASAQLPSRSTTALQVAADKAEIHELSAQFDNSLDSEDEQGFVDVFAPEGALQGFWGSSAGRAEVAKAFHFMLATFAKDKRHTVSNHQIKVNGDRATMYSYLTVFDRKALAVTGTATFTDTLERRNGRWMFIKRVLVTDPNVQPIIDSLSKK